MQLLTSSITDTYIHVYNDGSQNFMLKRLEELHLHYFTNICNYYPYITTILTHKSFEFFCSKAHYKFHMV